MEVHADRRDRIRARIAETDVDGLLVTHLVNVRYLTGFTGSSGTLLVVASGDDVFVTDGRYGEQAATEVADLPRVITREDGWLLQHAGGLGRLGVESQHVSWDRARDLDELLSDVAVVPTPGHVEALRVVKDDIELAALRRACEITAAAFTAACEWLRPGLSERQVAQRLWRELEDRGADDWSFEPIVAGGPNGARPHHRPNERLLAWGDLLTVDFGALVDGYHADMSRTVALGKPSAQLRDAYEAVAQAQRAGLDAVADGVTGGDVDAACRDVLKGVGLGDAFVHGTGHGVGLDIHEAPSLQAKADARLATRMTVTVEPGVYLPSVGGVRIEDVVLVGPGGCDVLTPASKDLLVL